MGRPPADPAGLHWLRCGCIAGGAGARVGAEKGSSGCSAGSACVCVRRQGGRGGGKEDHAGEDECSIVQPASWLPNHQDLCAAHHLRLVLPPTPLQGLVSAFHRCLVARPARPPACSAAPAAAVSAGASSPATTTASEPAGAATNASAAVAAPELVAGAAAGLAEGLLSNARFELLAVPWAQAQARVDGDDDAPLEAAAGGPGEAGSRGGGVWAERWLDDAVVAAAVGGGLLVEFSVVGSALHGVDGAEVNAAVLRQANASGRLLLIGATAPASISAVDLVQRSDRCGGWVGVGSAGLVAHAWAG